MAEDVTIPGIAELLWPVLKTMRARGDSASRAELLLHVPEVAGFTEEQLADVYPGSTNKAGVSKVQYRAELAIYWLKKIGVFEGSPRVYTVTPEGARYLEMDDAAAGEALTKAYREARKSAAKKEKTTPPQSKDTVDAVGTEPAAGNDASVEVVAGTDPVSGDSWKTALLEILQKMSPAGFERLAQRILREAGFQKVDVVGRAGDGGIDGRGLYRMSLVSFPIYFQCKRYAGSVPAGVVRDFRGAMAGRGDKGLIVTTGTFTSAARKEATRDGAPPVDLIDGDELCDLIRKYKLGVVERVTVDESFFEKL